VAGNGKEWNGEWSGWVRYDMVATQSKTYKKRTPDYASPFVRVRVPRPLLSRVLSRAPWTSWCVGRQSRTSFNSNYLSFSWAPAPALIARRAEVA